MPDRLSPLDVSFLHVERPATPVHVGGVAVLNAPPAGLDLDRLARLVSERIALVPRYRQRIRWVPAALARPVWADDPHFDLAYHVRQTALPAPGTDAQLHELAGRLMARRLDRGRPLWELYLVEGLGGGRVAIVSKTHPAVVDGANGVDLVQVLLDDRPDEQPAQGTLNGLAGTSAALGGGWHPQPDPGAVSLAAGALAEMAGAVAGVVRHPTGLPALVRGGVRDAGSVAVQALGATGGGLLAAVRTAARPAPETPLNVPIGPHRRFAAARTDLESYRRVRAHHGGVTVNDVVLTTVAGALRQWLLSRGVPVRSGSVVRAMVPTSVRGTPPDGPTDAIGGVGGIAGVTGIASVSGAVSSCLVDLPVGEPSPTIRLAQIAHIMRVHAEPGRRVSADALTKLSGFAPATLHTLGARAVSGLSRRLFNLVVTNAPGPQRPLYAAGARLAEVYPVVPLTPGQAVAVGVTSYDGGVYYGLNADRDALTDVETLAGSLGESLNELTETVR